MASDNRYYYGNKFYSRAEFLKLGVKCVFISYQKRDCDEATKVAEYLQNAGVEIYFDKYDRELRIQHQSDNPKEVTQAICSGINNSSHMLVLVSPNTMYSSWVPFEIGYGYEKTELGVLCLKGIPKGKLPEYIRTVPVIRDIYDLNLRISKWTGKEGKILVENKAMSDHASLSNPLSGVMDSFINDTY